MPDCATVFAWMRRFPEFLKQYARAKEESADAMAEDILDIADTPQIGAVTKTKPDGSVETREGDMIEHRRLQVDARKWLASKLKPKKYGDRVDLTNSDGSLTGADALAKARARVTEWRDPAGTSLNGNGEAREH